MEESRVEGDWEEGLERSGRGVLGGRGDEEELPSAGVRVALEVVEPEDGADRVADDDGGSGDGIERVVEGVEPVVEIGVSGVWEEREVDAMG
jgi:hypothetical protein